MPQRTFIYMGNSVPVAVQQASDGLYEVMMGVNDSSVSAMATAIQTPVSVVVPSTDDVTLIASASYNASQNTADQINVLGAKGAFFILDVTTAAGALKTLEMQVQVKDPASGKYLPIATSGVIGTTVTLVGTYIVALYPSSNNLLSATLSSLFANGFSLPRTYRIRMIHSDGTAWVYSVGRVLLR